MRRRSSAAGLDLRDSSRTPLWSSLLGDCTELRMKTLLLVSVVASLAVSASPPSESRAKRSTAGKKVTDPAIAGKTKAASDRSALTRACDSGDSTACGRLGFAYAHGDGVANDDAKAVALYRRACDGGVTGACGNLGFMYATGRGVTQDEKASFKLYEQACNGGSVGDCTNLASAFHLGQGVAKDLVRAQKLYSEGCEARDAAACTGMGILSEELGTSQGDKTAAGFFRRACDEGDALGCGNLGFMLRSGRGVAADPAAARKHYRTACDAQKWEHCVNLGILLVNAEGGPQAIPEAVNLLESGCNNGKAAGCATLADMHDQNKRPEKAKELRGLACKLGDAESCAALKKTP